jgi:hypothetical protein
MVSGSVGKAHTTRGIILAAPKWPAESSRNDQHGLVAHMVHLYPTEWPEKFQSSFQIQVIAHTLLQKKRIDVEHSHAGEEG